MRFLTQRRKGSQRRKGRSNTSIAPESLTRLCVFAIFAPLRQKLLFYLFICILLPTACSKNNTTTSTPVISSPPTGTTYPMPPTRAASLANMGWELADGNRAVFSEYKGKVLILDFYATWCEPCRDSIPHLIGLQKKYADQGLQVVGLNVGGPGDNERVPAFAKDFGIQYPLAQPDEELASFLLAGQDAIPQTFVFDRQGQLVQRFIGFGSSTGTYLDSAVETALKTPTN